MIPPQALPDLYLIHKVQNGDREAFSGLYRRHVRRVFGMLFRLTTNADVAEDLTQETFVAAYRSLATYERRGAFSTWLCGIALRVYRGYWRSQSAEPETEPLGEELPASTDDPLAACTRSDAERALGQAIRELPVTAREAFVLVRVEGYSYQAAADLLEIPLGTLQSRMHRATRLLHRSLRHLIVDDPSSLTTPREARHVIR